MLLPAVVHWRVGHYAAIIKEQAGRYLIEDPTFHDNLWISRAALDAEASGYYLVPAGPLPAGWQPVSAQDGGQVWGKGNTTGNDKDRDTPCDDKAKQGGCGAGMAQYNMHTMLVSLNITDTPLFYDTPHGGGIAFTVTYNQREANQPATFSTSNFGQKWSCNWMSWIADDPSLPSADATLIVAGGGARVFQSFNAGTQSYAPDAATKAVLVRTSATSYEQRFSDGSKEVFFTATAVTGAGRKVFLTQRVDATGNAVGLTYDSTYRLAGVTDTLGQVSIFSYEQAGDPLKITKITDTFGRTAQFAYNGAGYLQQITDMIGLTSQFTYTGSFINALTTPYGTTTFAYGEVGAGTSTIRWLEATDPLGGKERLEYRHNAPGIATSDPVGTVPAGISLTNAYLNYRNSFFWDKKAMMEPALDYTKAKITHWLHTSDGNAAAGVKESEKSPLENRVWYSYPYQPNSYYIGSDERPFARAQALSDGTTQVAYWQYNALGNLTKSTDPIGRVTDYLYDPAGLDLVEVRNHTGNLYELLASFTYTDALHLVSIHQPLTRTDAAGQVTGYNYNARGQKLTETVTRNGQPETTTWNYDAGGYLQNITGPLAGATVGFTYDGYGRMQTVTDSENYTATSTYDGLNRPLKTTYPDGTFEQTIYNKLDAEWQRDRLGRWSRAEHDELQRTTATTDPAGRKVQYDWCVCGALHKLIDAAGQTTEFEYDIQRRPTKRTFADGNLIKYFYDPAHSLLSAVLDAQGQKTHYIYTADDRIATITYTDALDQPLNPPTPGVSYVYGNNYPHLKEFTDGTGTTTLDYYNVHSGTLGAGRLQAVNGPLTGKVDKITYTYDELGRVTGRTLNTTAESITLDVLGRVTAATNALGSFLTGYVNATARPQTVTFPNNQTTTYTYYPNTAPAGTGNGDQRLQTIWHQDAAAATLSKHDYSYNPGGEITDWTQQAGPAPATAYGYEYDRASQLLAATRKDPATNAVQKQYTYRYDLAGNRTLEQIDNAVSSATYNSVNQLTARTGAGPMVFEGTVNKDATVTVGGIAATVNAQNRFTAQVYVQPGQQNIEITARDTQGRQTAGHAQVTVEAGAIIPLVSYDLNGNQTADGARTYDWDAANRLVKITQGGSIREFAYNGFGQRMSEKVNGTVTKRWLWDGTEMIAELDASNAVTKRFFTQGEQIAGASYYYTRDHLGSIREVTDATNTLRARYDYDPWGRRSANLVTTNPVESDFGFTGHYYDAPTGMHVAYYRWLDGARWLSRDPIGEEGGMNLYAYVNNEPIGLIDPFGLDHVIFYGGQPVMMKDNPTPGQNPFSDSGYADRFFDAVAKAYADAYKDLAIAAATEGVGGLLPKCEKMIARGGCLNSNRYLRIGIGRDGGRKVLRIAGDLVGKIKKDPHIVIKDLGPL